MFIATVERCSIDLVDLGDASVETRQVWFGWLPDNEFGLGFYRG